MTRPRRRCIPQPRNEAGLALILVMLVSLLLLLIPLGVAVADEGEAPLARYEVDRAAALAASDAGIDDYINRLDNNPNYWQQSVPANLTNGSLPAPGDNNPALDGWVRTSSLGTSAYCYAVDVSYSAGSFSYNTTVTTQQGTVVLTAYGYSSPGTALPAAVTTLTTSTPTACSGAVPRGGVERVVQVRLQQHSFLDYAEVDDLNIADPNMYDAAAAAATGQDPGYVKDNCFNTPTLSLYYWAGNVSTSPCFALEAHWGTNLSVHGPIWSNDDYLICGSPDFSGTVTSGDPSGANTNNTYWADPYGCVGDDPSFDGVPVNAQPPGKITEATSPLVFPTSNSADKAYAQAGGCYYVGPTDITYSGNTMTAVSPMSTSSTTNPACLGTGVALPANGVIYVDEASSCSAAFNVSWIDSDLVPSTGCENGVDPGDVFVQGSGLSTGLTINADDNVYIDGSLTDASTAATSPDILGLIANKNILVVHPVAAGVNIYTPKVLSGLTSITTPAGWGTASCPGTLVGQALTVVGATTCTITIDAAMLSIHRNFGVQDFMSGSQWATLDIVGSLAEGFKHLTESSVNGGYTGAAASYTWDPRLVALSPPHFLTPTNTQWQKLTYEECPPSTGCRS